MGKYDAYLFDWDGTLAESLEVWMKVIEEVFRRAGLNPTFKDIVKSLGRVLETAMDIGLPEDKVGEILKDLERSHIRVFNAPLYPDVRAVLAALKSQGKQIAIVSTGYRETLQKQLQSHKLTELVDVLVASSDVKLRKPHPDSIYFALEKLGISKDKALMVGDSEKDLGAAQNAGVDSLLFYPKSHEGVHDLDYLKEYDPTYIVRSWREMLDRLQ